MIMSLISLASYELGTLPKLIVAAVAETNCWECRGRAGQKCGGTNDVHQTVLNLTQTTVKTSE